MSTSPRIVAVAVAAAALAVPASAAARAKTSYYVALGDSYAQGVQAIGPNFTDENTNKGFNDFAYKKLRKKHPGLKLVKLGCGGETTTTMINGSKVCNPHPKIPYNPTSKATSQLTYAAKWLKAHRGKVAYVTISIGGNDFAHCATAGDIGAVASCVSQGVAQMKKNLPVIAKKVRKAAGKKAVIVGSTYPDVVLGEYVRNDNGKQLAQASVSVFKDQINPALKSAYKKQKIRFADTTAAFGGYTPFSKTTTLAPYGQIPVAVANICKFGWYCATLQAPDIHLRTSGYAKFAKVVVKEASR